MKKTAVIVALGVACSVFGKGAYADGSSTVISGKTYVDLTSKSIKDSATGAKSADSGYGSDVKRFYLGVSHQFDSTWSATFLTDIGDQNGKHYDVFVKKAFVQAKLAPSAIFRGGVADMPWIPFVEDIYGYRYVENTLTDRLNIGHSADWGTHFLGNAGIFNYAVSLVNGGGYANPARSKRQDLEARLAVEPVHGLTVAVGGYSGDLGKDTNTTPATHTANRIDGLVAYVSDDFRVGGEYFHVKNWNTVTAVPSDSGDGYSLWASALIMPRLSLFGRMDRATPSKDLNPGMKDSYELVGLQYQPNKAVNVALAYKHEKVDSGIGGTAGYLATSEGSIGSSTPHSSGKYNEVGVWAQYAF